MIVRTLTITAIAASLATMPMLACATDAPQEFNNCVKAFMADLSKKSSVTLRLRDSRYFSDYGNLPTISGMREIALVARDAHDHHAIARASCAVNAQGDIIELR